VHDDGDFLGDGALAPVVDALVREPVAELCVRELQALLVAVVPQVQRLEGLVSLASGQLQALTGGSLPMPEGGNRTVTAGWLSSSARRRRRSGRG
jgi:hypothetical protein